MKWHLLIVFLVFIVIVMILGIVASVTEFITPGWAVTALGLGFVSLGLGVISLIIALRADRKTKEMTVILERIEESQKEIKKELAEQSGSRSTIIPTLETFSQMYMDYLSQQQSDTGQQDDAGEGGQNNEKS